MIGSELDRAAARAKFLRRIRNELVDLGEERSYVERLKPLALLELRERVTARLMKAPAGR